MIKIGLISIIQGFFERRQIRLEIMSLRRELEWTMKIDDVSDEVKSQVILETLKRIRSLEEKL